MTAVVYRKLPGKPRQYVRRIVAHQVLWIGNRLWAERMTANDAATVAVCLKLRSTGHYRVAPTEPQGEYGTEEVTT